jgi:hypothetical protein
MTCGCEVAPIWPCRVVATHEFHTGAVDDFS